MEIDYKKMDGFSPDPIESIPTECEAGSTIAFDEPTELKPGR